MVKIFLSRTRRPGFVVRLVSMRRLGARLVLGILTLLALVVDCWCASKPNIVLITMDAGRADRMGFLGAHGGLTPNLDRVAHESIIFFHAYAQRPPA